MRLTLRIIRYREFVQRISYTLDASFFIPWQPWPIPHRRAEIYMWRSPASLGEWHYPTIETASHDLRDIYHSRSIEQAAWDTEIWSSINGLTESIGCYSWPINRARRVKFHKRWMPMVASSKRLGQWSLEIRWLVPPKIRTLKIRRSLRMGFEGDTPRTRAKYDQARHSGFSLMLTVCLCVQSDRKLFLIAHIL
jgi:hypothetical protein